MRRTRAAARCALRTAQPADVAKALKLQEVKDKQWQIVPSNAITGQGLESGLDWLSDVLKSQS